MEKFPYHFFFILAHSNCTQTTNNCRVQFVFLFLLILTNNNRIYKQCITWKITKETFYPSLKKIEKRNRENAISRLCIFYTKLLEQ